MTSATQSNSGASAYLGFLSAFAGAPEVLRSQDLQRPEVTDRITRLLGSVERSSGSSGWLNDLILRDYGAFDAMVNYEALVIEANQRRDGTRDRGARRRVRCPGVAWRSRPLSCAIAPTYDRVCTRHDPSGAVGPAFDRNAHSPSQLAELGVL